MLDGEGATLKIRGKTAQLFNWFQGSGDAPAVLTSVYLPRDVVSQLLRFECSVRQVAEAGQAGAGVCYATDERIEIGAIGAQGADVIVSRGRRRRRCGYRYRSVEALDALGYSIEQAQQPIYVPARNGGLRLAKGSQQVFDTMRIFGNGGKTNDASRPLEGVSQAQQAWNDLPTGTGPLKLDHAPAKLVREIAGFDPEVFVRVARHAAITLPSI